MEGEPEITAGNSLVVEELRGIRTSQERLSNQLNSVIVNIKTLSDNYTELKRSEENLKSELDTLREKVKQQDTVLKPQQSIWKKLDKGQESSYHWGSWGNIPGSCGQG